MPKNLKIKGDDAVWKRAVDEELRKLRADNDALKIQIKYLLKRVK